jgi:hypothetical protein
MGLITETNYQYYEGSQIFVSTGAAGQVLQCTFDSQLDDHDRPPNIQTELNVTSIGNMFEVGPTIYNLTNQNAQPNQVGVGLTITIDTLAGSWCSHRRFR